METKVPYKNSSAADRETGSWESSILLSILISLGKSHPRGWHRSESRFLSNQLYTMSVYIPPSVPQLWAKVRDTLKGGRELGR